MVQYYRSYSEAIRNRKRGEITIYDYRKGYYRNVKLFTRFERRSLW